MANWDIGSEPLQPRAQSQRPQARQVAAYRSPSSQGPWQHRGVMYAQLICLFTYRSSSALCLANELAVSAEGLKFRNFRSLTQTSNVCVFLWTVCCCQGNLGPGALTCSDCFPALASRGGRRRTFFGGKGGCNPPGACPRSPSLCLFVSLSLCLNELFPVWFLGASRVPLSTPGP